MESRSKALWYALASAFAFAVMGVFVKLAADTPVLDKVPDRRRVMMERQPTTTEEADWTHKRSPGS